MVLEGVIRNGTIILDQPPAFPEGTRVEVSLRAKVPDENEPSLLGLLKFAGGLSDLPEDFAQQHDHYIHGTPKRCEKEQG